MAGRQVRIELTTPDWAAQFELTIPDAPTTLEDWLPLLRRLADRSASAAARKAEAAGAKVSCAKGCNACCHHLVAVTLVEAQALARLVAAMPEPREAAVRARFASARSRISESGVLEADHAADAPPLAHTAQQRLSAAWFGLGLACPFLEDGVCGVYEDRPLVCREHQVTSPAAACGRLFHERIAPVETPAPMGPALARATAEVAGVAVATIPLVMALELPPQVRRALERRGDPQRMLETLLGQIGEWRIEPIAPPA